MSSREFKVRAPLMPTYSELAHLLRIWDGVAKSAAYHMIQAIHNQTGTPQNPVDWSEPDRWIGERLKGDDANLARRIWEESGREVNPRHVNGGYLFVNSHALLVPDEQGIYRLSERGRRFLADDPEVIRKLDDQ